MCIFIYILLHVAENAMLYNANLIAPCFIEPGLWLLEGLHYRNINFLPVSSCDLDHYPITFIYELHPYFLEIYRMCKYELPTSRLMKVIV